MKEIPSKWLEKRIETPHGSTWHFRDAVELINELQNASYPYFLFGGEALRSDLSFAYAIWSCDYDLSKDHDENRQECFRRTWKFIKNYVARNGEDFYLVLVISDCYRGIELAGEKKEPCLLPPIDKKLLAWMREVNKESEIE